MTSGDRDPERPSTGLLVSQLSETINQIDENDLCGLAKMHGWCEALADACFADDVPESEPVGDRARSLLGELESLILGEVEDAGQVFAAVIESVAELSRTLETVPAKVSPFVQDDGANEETSDDDSVEAKLARVFDEAPSSEETAGIEQEPTSPAAAPTASDTPTDTPTTQEPPYEQVPLTLKQEEIEFVKGFVEEGAEHIEAIEAAAW